MPRQTYLVGGQLKGDSTPEGYVRALQQGCRSVECKFILLRTRKNTILKTLFAVDIWDGSEEPMIYHGRTLTSKLPVRDALVAIAKYAFIASPYPVILSMEIHCSHSQQDKLAELLKSILGEALVDQPLFGEETVEAHANCPVVHQLPSPESLKYKILVKAKNLYVAKAVQGELANTMAESVTSSEESSSNSSDVDFAKGELSLGCLECTNLLDRADREPHSASL